MAWFSLSTIGAGVPLGRKNAFQGVQFAGHRHRRRHDEDNVSVADQLHARRERILIDEAQRPVGRHRRSNGRLDLRVERVEDGYRDARHIAIHGSNRAK
jgi:hypothetical protein